MSTTHPVDSTYYPCCHAIGRHGPDCTADCSSRTVAFWDGQTRMSERNIGAGVYVTCVEEVDDGQMLRYPPRIMTRQAPDSEMTAAQARELAAQLLAAADLIDQACAL